MTMAAPTTLVSTCLVTKKEFFFYGHERDDVTAYRAEKLAKLDEITITPSQPCPNVAGAGMQYI